MNVAHHTKRATFHGATLRILMILALLVIGHEGSVQAASATQLSLGSSLAEQSTPGSVMFIENVGQMASEARYQVRGTDGAMWLTDNAIWISLQEQSHPDGSPPVPEGDMTAANVKLTFVGAATNPQLEAFDRLDTTVNYFTGRDSSEWLTNVPAWGGVRYMNFFPGVDLELSGQDSNLAWQWICGANCQAGMENMQLRVEGADTVQVQDGVLQLETVAGAVALPLPMLATHSLPQPVVTSQGERDFVITSPASIGLRTPAEAPGQVNLIYSGFLGGSAWDEARDIAVDSDGNAYVTGGTWSSNFPTVIGPDPTNSGFSDAFVVKVNPDGTALLYAGFVGGTSYDYGNSIAVDAAGNAYVTGETWSNTFPTLVGPFLSYSGGIDAFLIKVNATGSGLDYAGYLGGSSEDLGTGVAVDSANNAYVTGRTGSNDFPTAVGPDLSFNGGLYDAFVTKVNAAGNGLIYSGYVGGTAWDEATDIALEADSNATITGGTGSSDFPVMTGPGLAYNGGDADAFVTRVNGAGNGLLYSGYLGGAMWDEGHGIAVDATGNTYLTGVTDSNNFPLMSGPNFTTGGGRDVFVTKVDPAGSALVYSGLLGGSQDDEGYGIAVDGNGNAHIAGMTESSDFPVAVGPFLTYGGGASDGFVTKLDVNGTALVFSGFMGGTHGDWSTSVAADTAKSTYIAGGTMSSDFPVVVGPDLTQNGGIDGWVAKLDMREPTAISVNSMTAQPEDSIGAFLPWLIFLAGLLLATLAAAWRRRRFQQDI